jgi:hypothetical protein
LWLDRWWAALGRGPYRKSAVSTRTYRPLQMHRIPYSDLSETQVARALRAADPGPGCSSPLSSSLVGRRVKLVADAGGPTLEYHFRSERDLEFTENGGKALKAKYGALATRALLLVSHMIPGTQRGFQLILDPDKGLATIVEVRFSAYVAQEIADAQAGNRPPQFKNGHRNREVQRTIWFAYIDDGKPPPSARHTFTNRLEGKGLHWTQDNGIETLEFFLTVSYSNFVELTRFGGEMTICAPSDYIMINDHEFIYSRIECEFSGTFTLQIIDLFAMTQKGVRLGLSEKDELEYYLYSGTGDITGQIASFEVFGDNGEKRSPRRVYRPLETFDVMSDEEVREQVLHHAIAFGDGKGSGSAGMGGYKGPRVERFSGKRLTVRMDAGPLLEYEFADGAQLKWRNVGDQTWREAWYEMYEPDEELYFFAHLLDAEFPRSCAMVALDMKNGLCTLVKGTTGTPFRNNETHPTFYFGVFQTDGSPTPPMYLRHGFTEEMMGEAVTWNYQPGNPGLSSMHFYATPSSYSWIIFQPDGAGGLQWSSPGWYSKLRDGVYLMAWVEEACNGTLGVICFNQRIMHDAGFGFHVGRTGLTLNVIGARARHAGKFDLKKYIGIKS